MPGTYIRTFPDDAETVKVGGEPDLVPHTRAQLSPPEHLPGSDTPPPAVFGKSPLQPRSAKQQSWGTVIAIIIIVVMVVIGAFYAWGKRVAERQQYPVSANP